MRDSKSLALAKWPFLVCDLLMVGAAGFVFWQSTLPLSIGPMLIIALCLAVAALCGMLPFVLEYQARMKVAETEALTSVTEQVTNLDDIANQIRSATGLWHSVQEAAEKTAARAKEIADRSAADMKVCAEFLNRANDSEKTTLRLEVEKLRRAEGEWLQVLVRLMDHVYALNRGAVRSGDPNLIENLSQFQHACRDAARRVGLGILVADPAEPFNPKHHQLVKGDAQSAAGKPIAETLATGYTFQGRLIRPLLVRLESDPSTEPVAPATPEADQDQRDRETEPSAPSTTGK